MFHTNTDPVDAVRQQQENEGRRRISLPGDRPSAYSKTNKTTYKKPFVAKGHDLILDRVQKAGEVITLVLISGDTLKGTIAARDKFTITMRVEAGREVFENTVYKHAIELISRQVVEPAPVTQEA